jgi:hypothetical protein
MPLLTRDPAFMRWDSWNFFRLSLVLSLLMMFTQCCCGLMMCSIHLDEFATHVSKVAWLSHLYVLFAEKLDSLLDRLDNRRMKHSPQSGDIG